MSGWANIGPLSGWENIGPLSGWTNIGVLSGQANIVWSGKNDKDILVNLEICDCVFSIKITFEIFAAKTDEETDRI